MKMPCSPKKHIPVIADRFICGRHYLHFSVFYCFLCHQHFNTCWSPKGVSWPNYILGGGACEFFEINKMVKATY